VEIEVIVMAGKEAENASFPFHTKGEVDMKSRIAALFACLILAAFAYVDTAIAQGGQSPSNAVPIGMSIKTQVECGERAGSMEPYDAKIAVLQVLRGKEALDRIKAANPSSQPPKAGFDYVVARVAFQMNAILAPGNKTFELARKMQFVALTADGNEQDPPLVTPPSPELHRTVRSGEPAEGWIVLLVEQSNKKPVMFFDPAAGGAMGGGKVLFFQLY
jgi:hypothetical protein